MRENVGHPNILKYCIWAIAIYIALAILFYFAAGDQLQYKDEESASVKASEPIGELTQDIEIVQSFIAGGNEIRGLSLLLSTYDRINTCTLQVCIEDGDGNILTQEDISCESLADNQSYYITFDTSILVEQGNTYQLILSSSDATSGNAISLWQGNTASAGRGEVRLELDENEELLVGDQRVDGKLVYNMTFRNYLLFGKMYWFFVLAFGMFLAIYGICQIQNLKKGKSTIVLQLINSFKRYRYLMKQIISRDFKTRYKRSVLGVLWSFLNPMLTMAVQYVVFSALFKTDIQNFALYLLCGIVCYNFFSEATTTTMTSITGNAHLITKVYVPKYIYPVSKVLSTSINLLMSMIPLFFVMLITVASVNLALVLLPFGIICLMTLCLGIGLILASLMVFFRDTQFLWGVASMMWMYATPIFYPESIIPERFMLLYKCNPLYHIIRFIRTVLISGISPEPREYVLCLIVSFVPLLVGVIVFNKTQDQFVMNL